MRQAYLIYVLMFAVLISAMSLILTYGRSLKAPDDLSGDWDVTWEGIAPAAPFDERLLHVQQSGRFFVVRFGKSPPMSLTLQRGWHGARDGRTLQMELIGDGLSMRIEGDIPLNSTRHIPLVQVELERHRRHSGVARRREERDQSAGAGPHPHIPTPPGVARAR